MAEDKAWHELWGTFSVKDHCRPGAFVAEVLLYDKLLIPVPPSARDGVGAEGASAARAKWEEAGWNPSRQSHLLGILGDRVEMASWGAELEADWQSKMNGLFADARRDGFFMTGSVLQRLVPAMARSVVAVPQYRSIDELEAIGIRRRKQEEALPAGSLMTVLGYELLLPDDPSNNEDEVLARAVEVAADPRYREKRKALWEWQQRFMSSEGLTDASSIKAAVKEMRSLVDQLKQATDKQKRWKWAKRCFSFLGAASKGAGLVFPPVAAVAAAGDAVISIGKFVTEEGAGVKRFDAPSLPAASLILDARERMELDSPQL